MTPNGRDVSFGDFGRLTFTLCEIRTLINRTFLLRFSVILDVLSKVVPTLKELLFNPTVQMTRVIREVHSPSVRLTGGSVAPGAGADHPGWSRCVSTALLTAPRSVHSESLQQLCCLSRPPSFC